MIKIGITGQSGFIGSHLYNTLRLYPEKYICIPFEDAIFDLPDLMESFVSKCDVIIHLAGVNRHSDPAVIYETNLLLIHKLIQALDHTGSKAHLIFSSSSQEEKENPYGKSKKEGRLLLSDWSESNDTRFTGLIIPNVFGPFGNPYYNSVVATFSHQLNHGEIPGIDVDSEMKLIYVGELVAEIIKVVELKIDQQEYKVDHTATAKVTDILQNLQRFRKFYAERWIFPRLETFFEINLFNTFRSYMDIKTQFPVKLEKHTDTRGSFFETIKMETGGQVSFSTTLPGVTRGNHFHCRKIERFAVVKGKARIQLRRVGTSEVMDYYLSGEEPSFVDMPVWYTHNITNVGQDNLYTIFWINELFNPEDPDTFFDKV